MTQSTTSPLDHLLWRVVNYGRQSVRANDRYWWDNRGRTPQTQCVIQLIEAGEMIYRQYTSRRRHIDIPVHAGNALIFFFNDNSAYGHPAQPHTAMKLRWLCLEGAGMRELLYSLTDQYSHVVPAKKGSTVYQSFEDAYNEARRRKPIDDFQETQSVHQLILDVMQEVTQRGAQALPPVEQAIQAMLRRPTSDWSLGEIADRHQVSREHLTRVFTEKVGTTPARFLNEKRIELALQLLTDTPLSVKQIAEQAGFSTTRTLTRQIKQATGDTPIGWREKHQTT